MVMSLVECQTGKQDVIATSPSRGSISDKLTGPVAKMSESIKLKSFDFSIDSK